MQTAKLKTVFLGSNCFLSHEILRLLLKDNPPCLVLCHTDWHSDIPLISTTGQYQLQQLAQQHAIPYQTINGRQVSEWLAIFNKNEFDVALSACFPVKIPAAFVQQQRPCFLNIHPSQLPYYKGPDPVFWQLYYGESAIGLNLHQMNKDFDSGAIVKLEAVTDPNVIHLSDVSSFHHLEQTIANQSLHIIVKALSTLANPENQGKLKFSAQKPGKNHYFSWPTNKDLIVPVTDWNQRRVYYFILFMLEKFKSMSLDYKRESNQQAADKSAKSFYKLAYHDNITSIVLSNPSDDYQAFVCADQQSVWIHKQCLTSASE